ncbi:hypothetical protein O1611_g10478 [Lasiodiplodia mahajangana]|uniref:Uncharacterized protein n=1 Tax=Lasiodiplodia mahajangana TaxID=1108764 RepID=A0ACC2IY11_9PEZI|nr:hypothetical protein O1611_g10478 [Lasiodiplodia mahajangana]
MLILTRPPAVVAFGAKQYFVYPRVCPFRYRTVKICLADEKQSSRISDGHVPCSLSYFDSVDHLRTGLSKTVEDFLRKDDVFCEDFLGHILIVLSNDEELLQPIAQDIFSGIDLFPFENSEYQIVVERFVGIDGDVLRAHSDRKPLRDYLDSTIPKIQLRDCYNNAEDFRLSYARQFGKKPYIDPVIQYKWDLSQDITDEEYEEGIIEKHTFRQWISTEIIPPSSKSVLLLPGGVDSPTYRDEYDGTDFFSG